MTSESLDEELRELRLKKVLSATNVPSEIIRALFEEASETGSEGNDTSAARIFPYLGGTVSIAEFKSDDPDLLPVLDVMYDGSSIDIGGAQITEQKRITYTYDSYAGCWSDPVVGTVGIA